jgi:hypothetical protein
MQMERKFPMKALLWMSCLAWATIAPAADDSGVAAQAADGEAIVVAVTADENGEVSRDVRVVKIATADTPGASPADTEAAHTFVVKAVKTGDATAGVDVDHDVQVFTRVSAGGDPNRGWLGVALGQSVSTDSATGESDSGVVVMNVVKGSPADTAGLLKDDVITTINGVAVSDGVRGLAQAIGELGAGGEARLAIVRDGEPMEVTATLSAPQAGGIEWHHAPNMKLREYYRTRPHVGMLSPHGKMRFFHQDDMDELPEGIAELLGKVGTSMQVSVEDGNRVIELKNNDNGEVLEIRREGEGPISVKRYPEGADDVEAIEYADTDALQAGDEEAYEIFQRHAERTTHVWIGEGDDVKLDFHFNFDDEDFDLSQLHEDLADIVQVAPMSKEALEAAREAMKSATGQYRFFSPGANLHFQSQVATRSFRVEPDGSIELTLRKGDTEIVEVYADESDLAKRNPDAFSRYQDVINAEIDE